MILSMIVFLIYTVVDCGQPSSVPRNGGFSVARTVYRSLANYFCTEGNRLTGSNGTRTCQANGQWSGEDPSCEGTNYKGRKGRGGGGGLSPSGWALWPRMHIASSQALGLLSAWESYTMHHKIEDAWLPV